MTYRTPLRRRLPNKAEKEDHEAHCAEVEARRETIWNNIREWWKR
jgi:hypothetical protein